jgi:hypothetical protein
MIFKNDETIGIGLPRNTFGRIKRSRLGNRQSGPRWLQIVCEDYISAHSSWNRPTPVSGSHRKALVKELRDDADPRQTRDRDRPPAKR